jgi:hypothetical protein
VQTYNTLKDQTLKKGVAEKFIVFLGGCIYVENWSD